MLCQSVKHHCQIVLVMASVRSPCKPRVVRIQASHDGLWFSKANSSFPVLLCTLTCLFCHEHSQVPTHTLGNLCSWGRSDVQPLLMVPIFLVNKLYSCFCCYSSFIFWPILGAEAETKPHVAQDDLEFRNLKSSLLQLRAEITAVHHSSFSYF